MGVQVVPKTKSVGNLEGSVRSEGRFLWMELGRFWGH